MEIETLKGLRGQKNEFLRYYVWVYRSYLREGMAEVLAHAETKGVGYRMMDVSLPVSSSFWIDQVLGVY
jgi:hypothetical protein